MIKNKKADSLLMPEVMKLFLAVIVIGFLVILAYKLYGIFIIKGSVEQARTTLEQIKGKIDVLEEGDKVEILIVGPKDWYIQKTDKKTICFCDKDSFNDKGCGENSICANFDKEFIIENICQASLKCFSLAEVPKEISISLIGDKITFRSKDYQESVDYFNKFLEYKVDDTKKMENLLEEYFKTCQINGPSLSCEPEKKLKLDNFIDKFLEEYNIYLFITIHYGVVGEFAPLAKGIFILRETGDIREVKFSEKNYNINNLYFTVKFSAKIK
ncbi:MAG: hypothetical protein KJ559_02720 [Nanoarchaeota archaeon]|nr:hypothetical protein [Nanoarchaeota archaeon]